MNNDKDQNGRTHEPSLRELTSELDGVKLWLLEKVESLRDLMNERHALYKERSDSQKTALEAALAAANAKNDATSAAGKEDITKYKNAQTAYNTNHNDILKKQELMMPRTECEREFRAWAEKFDDLKTEIINGKQKEREAGSMQAQWTFERVFAILMFLTAVAAIFWRIPR